MKNFHHSTHSKWRPPAPYRLVEKTKHYNTDVNITRLPSQNSANCNIKKINIKRNIPQYVRPHKYYFGGDTQYGEWHLTWLLRQFTERSRYELTYQGDPCCQAANQFWSSYVSIFRQLCLTKWVWLCLENIQCWYTLKYDINLPTSPSLSHSNFHYENLHCAPIVWDHTTSANVMPQARGNLSQCEYKTPDNIQRPVVTLWQTYMVDHHK